MSESNTIIYHVVQPADVKAAQQTGLYDHPSLATEGFIHCCLIEQLTGVVERYYANVTGLELMAINPDKLKPKLVYENTVGGKELFPHVYGKINMNAVVEIKSLEDSLD